MFALVNPCQNVGFVGEKQPGRMLTNAYIKSEIQRLPTFESQEKSKNNVTFPNSNVTNQKYG